MSSKVHILLSVCLQWCTYLCQYVFKSSHLGVSMSLWHTYFCHFVFKNVHLGVNMSSMVHILVSVCLQKFTSLCQYVFNGAHTCISMFQKCISWCHYVFKSSHIGVSMSSMVHILVSVCFQKYTFWCHYYLKKAHLGVIMASS